MTFYLSSNQVKRQSGSYMVFIKRNEMINENDYEQILEHVSLICFPLEYDGK